MTRGINNSFKTSLMLICFGSAGVLFSVARSEPEVKQESEARPKTTEMARVSLLTPELTKALAAISTRLVVDLSEARVESYWGNQRLASYPVAIGKPGWETPTGTFKVLQKQRNPVWRHPITGDLIPSGLNNPLGSRWIGFWSDGRNAIGFHGTNDEKFVGQPVSHGCIRMRNPDIQALYEQVRLGTLIVVRK